MCLREFKVMVIKTLTPLGKKETLDKEIENTKKNTSEIKDLITKLNVH